MACMDKRLLLNIIIVSIISFYLVFGIAYRGLLEESEPDLMEDSAWDQPFLIPKNWRLSLIEFPNGSRLVETESGWSAGKQVKSEVVNLIANNWQQLLIQDVADYSTLPKGTTTLVFVEQQPGPIVFRLVQEQDNLLFYRLNDKRLFKLPVELKSVIWID